MRKKDIHVNLKLISTENKHLWYNKAGKMTHIFNCSAQIVDNAVLMKSDVTRHIWKVQNLSHKATPRRIDIVLDFDWDGESHHQVLSREIKSVWVWFRESAMFSLYWTRRCVFWIFHSLYPVSNKYYFMLNVHKHIFKLFHTL